MESFLGGNSGRQKKRENWVSSIGKKKKFEQNTQSQIKKKERKTGEFKVAHDIVLSRSIRSRLLFIAQTEL